MADENNKNFHFHFTVNSLTNDMIPKTESLNQEIVLSSSFTPPLFGVTGLPSPFVEIYPEYKSNGLLIWINGRYFFKKYFFFVENVRILYFNINLFYNRGVIIDPPPFTQDILDHLGIPSLYIEWFILTKCHSSHDCGAFQKILASSRVEV